jgi:hypothetical protein
VICSLERADVDIKSTNGMHSVTANLRGADTTFLDDNMAEFQICFFSTIVQFHVSVFLLRVRVAPRLISNGAV